MTIDPDYTCVLDIAVTTKKFADVLGTPAALDTAAWRADPGMQSNVHGMTLDLARRSPVPEPKDK